MWSVTAYLDEIVWTVLRHANKTELQLWMDHITNSDPRIWFGPVVRFPA